MNQSSSPLISSSATPSSKIIRPRAGGAMGPTPEVRKMMAGSNAIAFTILDVYKLVEVS